MPTPPFFTVQWQAERDPRESSPASVIGVEGTCWVNGTEARDYMRYEVTDGPLIIAGGLFVVREPDGALRITNVHPLKE